MLSEKIKKDLDTIGSLTSSIGALIGTYIMMRLMETNGRLWYILIFLPPVLAYFFCTCTHNRRHWVLYSSGSVGGAIGSVIGLILAFTQPMQILFHLFTGFSGNGVYFFTPLLALIFSHLFHRRAQKREKKV